jgi:nucleotide-binding universal stress UspA family protein
MEAFVEDFQKLLFPVDLSDISQKVIPYAKLMAEKFNAEIHLLCVVHLFEEFSGIYVTGPEVARFEAELIRGAEQRMRDFSQEFFRDCRSCKTKVVAGNIADEIISYIEAEHIDLVVLGTHGRRGLDRLLFGSVAQKVIKLSPVPVLSINPYKAGA